MSLDPKGHDRQQQRLGHDLEQHGQGEQQSIEHQPFDAQQLIHQLHASSSAVDPYWSFQQQDPGPSHSPSYHDSYYSIEHDESATANLVHGLDLAAAAADDGNAFFPHLVQEQEQDADTGRELPVVQLEDRPKPAGGDLGSSPGVPIRGQSATGQDSDAGGRTSSTANADPPALNQRSRDLTSTSSQTQSEQSLVGDVPAKRKRGRPKGSKTLKRKVELLPKIIRMNPPLRPATDLLPSSGQALGAAGGSRLHPRPVAPPRLPASAHSVIPSISSSHEQPPQEVPVHAQSSAQQTINDEQAQSLYKFNKDILLTAARFYSEVAQIIERTPAPVLHQGLELTANGSQSGVLGVLSQAREVCEGLIAHESKLNPSPVAAPASRPPSAYDQLPRYHVMPPNTYSSFNGLLSTPLQHQIPLQHRGMPMHQLAGNRPASGMSFQQTIPIQDVYGFSLIPGFPHYADYVQSPAPASVSIPASGPVAEPSAPASATIPVSTPVEEADSTPPPPSSKLPGPEIPSSIPDISQMPSAPSFIHGAWQDVEVERLRMLAMASANVSDKAEVDWDWVIEQFGSARSRHQVLIKAVNLGLKESTTHPSRRRPKTQRVPAEDAATASLEKKTTQMYSPLLDLDEAEMMRICGGPTDSVN